MCPSKPFFCRRQFLGTVFILTVSKVVCHSANRVGLEWFCKVPTAWLFIRGKDFTGSQGMLELPISGPLLIGVSWAHLQKDIEQHVVTLPVEAWWSCAVKCRSLYFKKHRTGGGLAFLLKDEEGEEWESGVGGRPAFCLDSDSGVGS